MTFPFVEFSDALKDVSAGNRKIPKSRFLSAGKIPIVDQGQSLVAGFTDDVDAVVSTPAPLIVFGDHTRVFKFIHFPFAVGADGVKLLQVQHGFDPRFTYHYLNSISVPNAGYSRHFKFLKEVALPRPSIGDQRCIAAILDHVDALRAKRRQVLAHLATLTQSIFHDMFGRSSQATDLLLGDIAQVSSGMTKGRRTTKGTTATPYLAVSNVQDGHLRLNVVKGIEATDAEIQRYALKFGDLLLTEGGDPDKLGRGTLWRDELPLCLHQNHVFRVRVHEDGIVLPEYLAAYTAGRRARSYFLRSAKQTTGIASINKTQLSALPVTVPPLSEQKKFVVRLETVHRHRKAVERGTMMLDRVFASLQSRAFRGEL